MSDWLIKLLEQWDTVRAAPIPFAIVFVFAVAVIWIVVNWSYRGVLSAASLSSLFPLPFQVFNSPIDGGDQFMVPHALGPSLFRSQHVGELGISTKRVFPEHLQAYLACTSPSGQTHDVWS